MSYYTDYSMSYEDATEQEEEQIIDYMDDNSPLEVWGRGFGGYGTWYGHEEDMRALSSKFPNVLFILEGHGEENDDHWIKYFKGGKMQYCPGSIVYDDYDERKMK